MSKDAKKTERIDEATKAKKIKGVDEVVRTENIVVFKVTKPLTWSQHKALSERVRHENEKSGLKVVLAPCIVDGVEVE